MIDKNVVGSNLGSTPRKAINDSFFTAVAQGFSSEVIHANHKAQQATGLIASYISMGYTEEEAHEIAAGG